MEIQLIPQSYKAVEQEFDVRGGYGAQLKAARGHFGRASAIAESALNDAGYITARAMDPADCPAICERIKEGLEGDSRRSLAIEILDRVFSPEVDQEVISYFESEYAPLEAGFFEITPDEPESSTDGWHCGNGPSRFLRIMVCFTGSGEDGPPTLFAGRKITDDLKEAGYVFCRLDDRVQDLDPLTDALGFEKAAVAAPAVEPGDVVIFDSPGILHRRLLPKKQPRYVMTSTLIPSMLSWREVADAGTLPLPPGVGFPTLPGFAEGA